MLAATLALLLGFILGSVPFGYLLVRVAGRGDVRTVGSGNIGATNVGRVLGRAGWAATLVADAGKGVLAVWGAPILLGSAPEVAAAAGLGAIGGHCFTPWLGFRGGKGVATMLGAFLVLAPAALGVTIGTFAVVATAARIVSLASLAGAAALPIAAWALSYSPPVVVAALCTALVVLVRHRDNVGRILAGTESRIGRRT